MKALSAFLCVLATACDVGAQTPKLSISLLAPNIAQVSWPTNFNAWQLFATTNLASPGNWQPVSPGPFPLGNMLVVFVAITNQSAFFRLQPNSGNCVFHATPSTIPPGGSSTLSWCPGPGTTYQILPGIGPVSGSNVVVSPAVTTVFTLVSSNLTGVTLNIADVTVTAACQFGNATSWNCSLNFSYAATPSSSSYSFNINQQANLTYHLALDTLNNNIAIFKGPFGGNAQVNDTETIVGSPPPLTVSGSGTPLSGQSANLTINCADGTYTFVAQPVIVASWNGTSMDTRVGSVYVNSRALPPTYGPISSSESLPARSPTWNGSGDFYLPGGLGDYMFFTGVVTDYTAGNASVSWTFTPAP
jgi:hypothetical protein